MDIIFFEPGVKEFQKPKKPKTEEEQPTQDKKEKDVAMDETQEAKDAESPAAVSVDNEPASSGALVPALYGKQRVGHNVPGLDVLIGRGLRELGGHSVWYAACRGTGSVHVVSDLANVDFELRLNVDLDGAEDDRVTAEFVRTLPHGHSEILQADDVLPLQLYGKELYKGSGRHA